MVEESYNNGEIIMKKDFGLCLFELNLTNFATFSNQSIKFKNGFNAIIGETGSGKSLILDALQLILGHRADRKIIRRDCDHAVVEAVFKCECPEIKSYLDKLGFPFDNDEIIIKRLIYKNGKTKSYLNLQMCSLATIIKFTSSFVDLVGQFENQKLLSSKYQLKLLDNYIGHRDLLSQYKNKFELLESTKKELDDIVEKNSLVAQRTDYINYQIEEIDKISPSTERENELLQHKKSYQELSQNKNLTAQINEVFDGNDSSEGILGKLKQLESSLHHDLFSDEMVSQFHTAQSLLVDMSYAINTRSEIEINENEFHQILNELDGYQKLKRKFNVETEQLVALWTGFKAERDELDNLEGSIQLYKDRIESLENEAIDLAVTLHKHRIDWSKKLSKDLTKQIQLLNMTGAQISFNLEKLPKLTVDGFSKVDFIAETNPGEGFFKVKDIASGGELSRILLSIRNVLSSKDSISIFLFDEIDSGIGGETALTIGKSLAAVANSSQVIAITHLPQIANNADKLIIVSKESVNEDNEQRTISLVKEVQGIELAEEVALMTPLN